MEYFFGSSNDKHPKYSQLETKAISSKDAKPILPNANSFNMKIYMKEHKGQVLEFDIFRLKNNGNILVLIEDDKESELVISYMRWDFMYYMKNGHIFELKFVEHDNKIVLLLICGHTNWHAQYKKFTW